MPTLMPAPAVSDVDQRAELAAARIRDGLTVDEQVLDEIMLRRASDAQAGIYTAAEREDMYGDGDRVAAARGLLADAEDVDGGLEVCWVDGRRGIRLRLTAEHERYRRLLAEQIGAERVVIDRVTTNQRDLRALQRRVHADVAELAAQGIFLVSYGQHIGGFAIDYLAWDPEFAHATLRSRYGDSVLLGYRGATNRTLRPFPFASWHAEGDQLHVFYGLPQNGEKPGACHVIEEDQVVVVTLSIQDWRGAKTLVGGFTPSHATVRLSHALGDRLVIDDSANHVRPHSSQLPPTRSG